MLAVLQVLGSAVTPRNYSRNSHSGKVCPAMITVSFPLLRIGVESLPGINDDDASLLNPESSRAPVPSDSSTGIVCAGVLVSAQ